MLNISDLVFAVLCVAQVRSTNILLNKPSVQSGTNGNYYSGRANDGEWSYPSQTTSVQDPYWHGDLLGFYTVTTITVRSTGYGTTADYLRNAIIGVSVHDVVCSDPGVTICGQWPDKFLKGHKIVFNCPLTGPVKYVRIWREGLTFLSMVEVEAEGEPSRLTGTVYDKVMLQKVATPTTSLSVASVTDCSRKCLTTQPCLAFSYSSSEQPNCLLATCVTMTSDVMWVSYKVATSYKMPTCN